MVERIENPVTFWIRLLLVVLAALALGFGQAWAPALVLISLLLSTTAIFRARDAAQGTALMPAVYWAALTTALGILSQLLATFEPLALGRPLSGQLTYLTTLTALATLISVFNARTPGAGAWAILNLMLVLVFLIPWLEGSGLRGAGRGLTWLRLDNPWTIFYGLLVLAGVTNYLPTKYGPAAALLAIGFFLEYDVLTHPQRTRSVRGLAWSYFPLAWAVTLTVADARSRNVSAARDRVDAIWVFFRDHWGVVWALRVQERFNRSAESLGWPIRLHWQGVLKVQEPATWDPATAEALLVSLLRRFVSAERIDQSVGPEGESPCHPPGV